MSVATVIGSTRNPRIGPAVADYVHSLLKSDAERHGITLSVVDIAPFKLPVFDEPLTPAMAPARGTHHNAHSRAWSAEMARHDGYIFVIPGYNGGMAGATKNAIDYLYNEWQQKPVMIVGYGIKGGLWAAEQMKHALTAMKLRPIETMPALPFAGGGTGPSLMDAVQGKLNDESVKLWEADHRTDVLNAFSELVSLLKA